MARSRITTDIDLLMVVLIQGAFHESGEYLERPIEVASEEDVDTVDRVPLVIVSTGNGTMVTNGGPGLAWTWTVTLDILHDDREEGANIADHAYEIMHTLHDTGAGLPGEGYITNVEDISMPSHVATTLTTAGGLSQFNGTWTVTVQKA